MPKFLPLLYHMNTKIKNEILGILTAITASLIPALIFNKWIEAVVFVVCHTLVRPQFPRQYHHIIPAMCRLITALVFFFGISFVLPLSWSLASAIPINYFISWVGFEKASADYYQRKCEELQSQLHDTKGELIHRCRLAELSKRDTEIAVKYYYEKMTPKDIWLWLCDSKIYDDVEWTTVYQILWRIGNKIKNI